MATSATKFSKGYAGKKKVKPKAPPKEEVAGPYRSQSSVPSVRKQATPHEHRKVKVVKKAPTPAEVGLDVPKLGSKEQRRRTQRIKPRAGLQVPGVTRVRPSAPKVPTLTTRDPGNRSGYTPSPVDLAVQRDVIQPLQETGKLPKHKTLGQQIYDKVAEWGPTVLTAGPELKAAMEATNIGLRGVETAGQQIGGSAVSKALKPVKVATTPSKVASAVTRADTKLAQRTGSGLLRSGAKQAGKKDVEKQIARELTGTKTASEVRAAAGLPGAAVKGTAAQATAVVRGHEKALTENPGKTLGTTARALPGFVTVPVGLGVNVALTPGRAASTGLHDIGVPGFKEYSGKEILAPVKYVGKSQLDFAREVGHVVTSGDSDAVQKAVENELGLIIPITLGLGGKALADRLGKGDASIADSIVSQVRKVAEKTRKRANGRLGLDARGEGAKVFAGSNYRKQGAHTVDRAKRGAEIEEGDRIAGIRHEASRAARDEPVHPTGRQTAAETDLHVQPRDAVRFLVAHDINLDAPHELVIGEIRRLKKKLESDREAMGLPKQRSAKEKRDTLDTEDIFNALDQHPEWLKRDSLKRIVKAAREQEKESRLDRANKDHSEAARWEPSAIDLGVPTRHERVPIPERARFGGAKTWDEASINLAKDLQEHKRLVGRAKEEVRVAKSRLISGDPVTKEFYDRALDYQRRVQKMGDVLKARRREVRRGMDRGNRHADPELEAEMIAETKAAAEAHPVRNAEPEWTSEIYRQTDRPMQGVAGAKMPGGIKTRSGDAVRLGSPEEGLHSYLQHSITVPVHRKHIYGSIGQDLDRLQYKEGDKVKFTMPEVEARFKGSDSHLNYQNFDIVPDQLVKRIDDWRERGAKRDQQDYVSAEQLVSELANLVHSPDVEWSKGKATQGRTYRIVPKEWMKEVFESFRPADSRAQQVGRALNKTSNYLILNTSPAWAITQFGAEYAQAAIANPKLLNPLYARKLAKAYKAMDPVVRREFDTWVGATKRDLDWASREPLSMKGADDAYKVLDRTPYGRFFRGIPTTLRTVDQWKGSRIRTLSALAKMDKDFNGHLNQFLLGSGKMYRLQKEYSSKLRGKSPAEIAEFVTRNPALQERYRTYLDDMMGNWTALSKREQTLSQLVIFYPFLRMSLKWTFNTFPKNHPIRAAASYWVAQQNANELHHLLKGDPSFFGYWGNVPLYTSEHPTMELPLARLGLSGNALVEALGGSLENTEGPPLAALALSVTQPAITAGVRGITGLNKFTGEQEPHSGVGALNEVIGLSSLSRAGEKVKEALTGTTPAEGAPNLFGATKRQTSLDRLFAKLRGPLTSSVIRSTVFPGVPSSIELERDSGHLSRILTKLGETGEDAHNELKDRYREEGKSGVEAARAEEKLWHEYDKANKGLDKLFKKYGIDTRKEDAEYERFEEERKIGPQTPLQRAESILEGKTNPKLKKAEEALDGAKNPALEKAEKALGLE